MTVQAVAQSRSRKKWLLAGWLCLELSSLFLGGAVIAQKLKPLEPVNADLYQRLRGGNKLSIKFPYHAEFDKLVLTVRPDGFITLPLLKDVQVIGLTMPQLEKQLEEAYNKRLINPVVSVVFQK